MKEIEELFNLVKDMRSSSVIFLQAEYKKYQYTLEVNDDGITLKRLHTNAGCVIEILFCDPEFKLKLWEMQELSSDDLLNIIVELRCDLIKRHVKANKLAIIQTYIDEVVQKLFN